MRRFINLRRRFCRLHICLLHFYRLHDFFRGSRNTRVFSLLLILLMKSYINRNVMSLAIPVTIGTGHDMAVAQGALNALHCRLVHSGQPLLRIYVDSSWARMSEMQEWVRQPSKTIMMTHLVYEGDVGGHELNTAVSTAYDIARTWEIYEMFPPCKPVAIDFKNHFDVDEMLDLIQD